MSEQIPFIWLKKKTRNHFKTHHKNLLFLIGPAFERSYIIRWSFITDKATWGARKDTTTVLSSPPWGRRATSNSRARSHPHHQTAGGDEVHRLEDQAFLKMETIIRLEHFLSPKGSPWRYKGLVCWSFFDAVCLPFEKKKNYWAY